jgi:hypothetical protein
MNMNAEDEVPGLQLFTEVNQSFAKHKTPRLKNGQNTN